MNLLEKHVVNELIALAETQGAQIEQYKALLEQHVISVPESTPKQPPSPEAQPKKG